MHFHLLNSTVYNFVCVGNSLHYSLVDDLSSLPNIHGIVLTTNSTMGVIIMFIVLVV